MLWSLKFKFYLQINKTLNTISLFYSSRFFTLYLCLTIFDYIFIQIKYVQHKNWWLYATQIFKLSSDNTKPWNISFDMEFRPE